LPEDSFVTQPITRTIACPSCGETLLFGVKSCRFCGAAIDEAYALESARLTGLVTHACSWANRIRAIRPALLLPLVLAVFWYIDGAPSSLVSALILSLIGCAAPIRWIKKYGGLSVQNAEFAQARKETFVALGLWSGSSLIFGLLLAMGLWGR
jgi:hypothetical protein